MVCCLTRCFMLSRNLNGFSYHLSRRADFEESKAARTRSHTAARGSRGRICRGEPALTLAPAPAMALELELELGDCALSLLRRLSVKDCTAWCVLRYEPGTSVLAAA